MKHRLWTREELIVALNLYLKLPFGKLDARTKEVIDLARLLGRTPGSISMRLNNFASVDPYHQKRGITGLPGGKKQVLPIWEEFKNKRAELLFESELILAKKEKTSVENKYEKILLGTELLKGMDKMREVKTRVNQSVFRQIVMSNYNGRCAISGIDISTFLVASHIIPWSKNEKERLNPENGICFSSLYDCAFDNGYVTIDSKYHIQVSKTLLKEQSKPYYEKYFSHLPNQKINLPQKYMPGKKFLEYHRDVIFKK